MTNPKSRILAAVAGALSIGAASAWAADAATDAKIDALEKQVAELKAQQATNSKDLAATIDTVLRDAERRSQLLATMGDTGAGYDNGFYIRAGDNWVLRPGALFQFQGVADYRQNTGGSKGDETDTGFEIHRLELILEGTAFTRDLEYAFIWETHQEGGGFTLLDAWAKYMFADDWGVRGGQFKEAYSHEHSISDARLLAGDRSMVDSVMGGGLVGRTQGVSLIYGGYSKNNPFNAEVAFTDGANQINTDFTKHTFDFGVAGRLEWRAMGDSWDPYKDFTALGTKGDLLVIGVGADWSQSGDGDLLAGTIDAQWENNSGWGVYAGAFVRYTDNVIPGLSGVSLGVSPSGGSESDYGGIVQVSYMVPNSQWEIFGRWDFVDLDNDIVFSNGGTETFFNELTLGVNYYLGQNGSAGHHAKLTVDLTYLPEGSPTSNTFLGTLGDNNGDNEWVLRGQFQLWI